MFPYSGVEIPPSTAIKTWERQLRTIGGAAEQLYDACLHARRIYDTNDLQGVIGATPGGQAAKFCGDSSMTHDAACAAKAFETAFLTFMETVMLVPDIKPKAADPALSEPDTLAVAVNLSPLQICSTRPHAAYVTPVVLAGPAADIVNPPVAPAPDQLPT